MKKIFFSLCLVLLAVPVLAATAIQITSSYHKNQPVKSNQKETGEELFSVLSAQITDHKPGSAAGFVNDATGKYVANENFDNENRQYTIAENRNQTILPDTGQTLYYNNSREISWPRANEPFYGQDAHYPRARSYTKLDDNDNPLPDSATKWSQVRDNVTGLIWEVKQEKDGKVNYSNANDADNTYAWYDPNPDTNGGNAGRPSSINNTYKFIKSLNSGTGFCGHKNWRLPMIKEINCIINLGASDPAISRIYFSQTQSAEY
jgi:hypothetical protein